MNLIVSAVQRSAADHPSRRAYTDWEFAFCTEGSGVCHLEDASLAFAKGETVAVPPLVPHEFTGEKGSRIIHVFTDRPTLPLKRPTVISGDGTPWLQHAFEAALHHFETPGEEQKLLLAAYGNLIVCYLAASHKDHRLSRVVEIIRLEINAQYIDPGFELDRFLSELPFNYDYLRKLFQKEMGITPLQYLISLRLQTAAEALLSAEKEGVSMADIARMCGFREPLYFSRMFKKQYGVAPSFYLRSDKKQRADRKTAFSPPETDA